MTLWKVFYQAVQGYIQHGDLSRSAAIAFYTVTSLAPLLMASAGFPPTGSIRNSTLSTDARKYSNYGIQKLLDSCKRHL